MSKILLVEILVEVIDRITKKSLHEFRRYACIEQSGSYIRGKIYRQYDIYADETSIAFAARQDVLAELCSRDSRSAINPIHRIRETIDDHPWALDSVVLEKTEFDSKPIYEHYLRRNPFIKDKLLT